MAELLLRKTVIAGETAADDYVIIWNGITIGRILKVAGVGGGNAWNWGVSFPHKPQLPQHRGQATDLEDAKRRFKVVWSSIERELTEDDVTRAKEEQESFAQRPWNKHKRNE
jgi:hypothetical protein